MNQKRLTHASLAALLAAVAFAQEPGKPVPAAAVTAPTAPTAKDLAKQALALGFLPSLLRYHSSDQLPDFPLLAADGTETRFSAQRGKSTVVLMLPNVGDEPHVQPALAGAKAIAERYSAYGVKTLVFGLWARKTDFLAAAKTAGTKWPFPVFGDPVGPYAGPADDQDARMAHHRTTVLGTLFGGGMTPPLPAAFVVDGDGRLTGSFRPAGESMPFDGIANLLLRAGVKLEPKDMPREVAPPALWQKPPERPAEAPVTLVAVGSKAKDFAMTDVDGKPVRLADHQGKVVVLDFWATWCGPCKAALPHVQEVAAKYKDQGVVVIASCTNDGRDEFVEFVKANQAQYPDIVFAFDPLERSPERASRTGYGVSGIPQQFVIGRDGTIASMVDGYMKGEVLLDAALVAAGVKVDPAVVEQAAKDRQKREEMGKRRAVPLNPGK